MKAILDLREAKAANKTQKMVRYIPKINYTYIISI